MRINNEQRWCVCRDQVMLEVGSERKERQDQDFESRDLHEAKDVITVLIISVGQWCLRLARQGADASGFPKILRFVVHPE